MKVFSAATRINAPPETVWDILTDAPNYPTWDAAVERIEGTIAAGERITVHTKLSPRAFPVTVTTFEPPRHMTWGSGMPLGLFKGARTFTVTPRSDGGSDFATREEFTGLLLPLIGRTLPDLNVIFANFAAALKAHAEAQAA